MTMNTSKFIKSFEIEVGSELFKISLNCKFDRMSKHVSKVVFGRDDVAINESVLIDLLFDTDVFSVLHVTTNYMHFYENRRPIGSLIAPDESEADIEQFESMVKETIEVLKKHSDSLRADTVVTKEK